MVKIISVEKDSMADEMGIIPGDMLISINGQEVKDILDYKFLISDEYIELSVKKQDGEEWIYEAEKDYDEDLGLGFENGILDDAKSCSNKCIFCFVDQLPKGMRKSLYFKDDDSRLSFLHGNFITLTNMSDKDIERIIRYRISPLNISVHSTDPELRVMMLGNKRAGNILEIIKRLTTEGIDINCQIVLCRGINDGENLKKTLKDLYEFYPRVKNAAVVPVGITGYREKLYPLIPYDSESSNEVINLLENMQKECFISSEDVFARAADEFYVLAGMSIPEPEYYGEYEQMEDGVGMISLFMENIKSSLYEFPGSEAFGEVSVVTGEAAYQYVRCACSMIEDRIKGLKIHVHKILNNFLSGKITVSGLLTGRDIMEQLKDKKLGDTLYIPSNMLRSGEEILLDDTSVGDIEKMLKIKVKVCSFDGSDFVYNLCN